MSRTKQLTDVYQIVTNRIIEELEKGVIPWRQSWADSGPPMNLISRRLYRGINVMLLNSLNYEQNFFLTFDQLKEIGGSVRKGEKAHMVVYWNAKEVEDEKHEKKKAFLLLYYRVFNVSQCEGIPDHLYPIAVVNDNNPIASCDRIVDGMPNKPKIVHKEKNPFYHVVQDLINMPRLKSYKDREAYYLDLFHEIIHSTGHEKRVGRPEVMEAAAFGSIEYSMEELVAEIGACYLLSYAGSIREKVTDSASYIQGWLKILRDDKRFVFHASRQAQRAVEYILGDGSKEELVEQMETEIVP